MFGERGKVCSVLDLIIILLAELDHLYKVLFREYRARAIYDLAGFWPNEMQGLLKDQLLDLGQLP